MQQPVSAKCGDVHGVARVSWRAKHLATPSEAARGLLLQGVGRHAVTQLLGGRRQEAPHPARAPQADAAADVAPPWGGGALLAAASRLLQRSALLSELRLCLRAYGEKIGVPSAPPHLLAHVQDCDT